MTTLTFRTATRTTNTTNSKKLLITTILFVLVSLSLTGIWLSVRPYLQQSQQVTHTASAKTTRKVGPWKNVTTVAVHVEEHVVETVDATNESASIAVAAGEEQTPNEQVTIDATSDTAGASAIDASTIPRPSCPSYPNGIDAAMRCLRQSSPELSNLTYPSNPLEHVERIHRVLLKWTNHSRPHCAAGYCGPWLENGWISKFTPFISSENCLSDTFGPYIPLLIPWTDLWVNSAGRGYHYPKGFIRKLKQLLRRPYLYVTVSQNDWGIVGENEFPQWPNILVLSAGGYGHVPIPLLKQPEPLLVKEKVVQLSNFVSYVGSLEHDPFQLRPQMNDYLQKRQNESTSTSTFYKYYYGDDWRSIMWDSRYSLAPRGNGRTSYHLMEILQSGQIPIQVSQEVSWIPYATLYRDKWGYETTLADLPALMDSLLLLRDAEWQEREACIASYRESHFTTAGVLEHIQLFLLNDDHSDLECTVLPNSTLLS